MRPFNIRNVLFCVCLKTHFPKSLLSEALPDTKIYRHQPQALQGVAADMSRESIFGILLTILDYFFQQGFEK